MIRNLSDFRTDANALRTTENALSKLFLNMWIRLFSFLMRTRGETLKGWTGDLYQWALVPFVQQKVADPVVWRALLWFEDISKRAHLSVPCGCSVGPLARVSGMASLLAIKCSPVEGFLHPAVFSWHLDTEPIPGCGACSTISKIQLSRWCEVAGAAYCKCALCVMVLS